jgi:hypothetical protein
MSILDDEENYFAGRSGSGAFLGSDEDVSTSSLFAGLDLNALGIDPNLFAEGLDLNALLPSIIGDADVMNALKAQDPAAYAALLSAGELSGFTPVGSDNVTGQERVGPPASQLLTADGKLTSTGTSALTGEGIIADEAADVISEELGGDTNKITKLTQDSNDVATAGVTTDKTGTKSLIDTAKDAIKDITGLDAGDAAKYAAMLGIAKLAYDDAQRAREEARGWSAPGGYSKQAVRSPGGGVSFKKSGKAMGGGIGSLDMAQGGRALPPRYLNGHSDGMADKVPAHIDNKRPAALSDGEFVIPADVVSHLGNGNSNAGAKRLYKMMDDIRAARTGNPKQGKQINPDKFMPR